MKQLYTLLLSLCFILPIASAQDDNYERRIDETADNVSTFVENLVEQIETHVDRIVDDRSHRIEYSDDEEYQDQDKRKTIPSADAVTLNGNTEIAEQDTVQGDLVVKNGTLTVRGTVTGDVLVVNGDIELKSTSKVYGNVRAMNGGITKEDGAFVEGYTEQSASTSSRTSKRKNTYRTKYSYSFKPYFWNRENV
ncbi:MAG: polymer-forming cytoskeletal protein, partial [Bacteroidota bacterium]